MSELKNDFLKIAGDILDTEDRTVNGYNVACTEVDEENSIITVYFVDQRTYEIGNGCKENAERIFQVKIEEVACAPGPEPKNTTILEINKSQAVELISNLAGQLGKVARPHDKAELVSDNGQRITIYVR